MVSIVSTLGSI